MKTILKILGFLAAAAAGYGLPNDIIITQNNATTGTAQIQTIVPGTPNTLLGVTAAGKANNVAPDASNDVVISANQISLNPALTNINSITSQTGQNLAFGTGTFGNALTFASATGIGTFAAGPVAPTYTSTISTGTAPFTVSSTTLVTNLDAQYLGAVNQTWATPPAIGNVTPAAGFFTTLNATGNITGQGSANLFQNSGATNTFTIETTYSLGHNYIASLSLYGNVTMGNTASALYFGNNYTANTSGAFIQEATSGGGGELILETGGATAGTGVPALLLDQSQNATFYANILLNSNAYAGATNQSLTPAASALTEATGQTTINWAVGNTFSLTLNANDSIQAFQNLVSGQTIVVAVTNTASNYTITWNNSIKWTGGSQPVQTIGAHTDVWTIIDVGGTLYGSVVQNF